MAVTTVAAATLPALVGLSLLVSATTDHPLLMSKPTVWWNPLSHELRDRPSTVVRRWTILWGFAFLVVGLLQGAAAVFAGLSVADPLSALIRSAGAFILEALLMFATRSHLRRSSE